MWKRNLDNIDDLLTTIEKLVNHDYAIMTLVFEYGREMAEAATTVQRAGFKNDSEMMGAWMALQGQEEKENSTCKLSTVK